MKLKTQKLKTQNSKLKRIRIDGRPGDIKISNFYTMTVLPNTLNGRDLYVDITVANIFAPSYIQLASKERLAIAKKKEKDKFEKYNKNNNIQGIAMEVSGAMSQNGKQLIHNIASRLELRTTIPQSIWINRIRSTLIAKMMYHNARMIIQCYNL